MNTAVKNEDQDDIFFYNPNKPRVDTKEIFTILYDGYQLRAKTKNLNYLFNKLNEKSFDEYYNNFRAYLNLNTSPLNLNNGEYIFSNEEKTELEQKFICYLLKFYTDNNFQRILIKREDFMGRYAVMEFCWFLDKIYGKDDSINFKIAARILRISYSELLHTVEEYRRWEAMW